MVVFLLPPWIPGDGVSFVAPQSEVEVGGMDEPRNNAGDRINTKREQFPAYCGGATSFSSSFCLHMLLFTVIARDIADSETDRIVREPAYAAGARCQSADLASAATGYPSDTDMEFDRRREQSLAISSSRKTTQNKFLDSHYTINGP
jgi:hypothetical protein